LQGHLKKLPEKDTKSRAVIHQMISDETKHGDVARELGGAELPLPVRLAMQMSAKVMTRTAYWV